MSGRGVFGEVVGEHARPERDGWRRGASRWANRSFAAILLLSVLPLLVPSSADAQLAPGYGTGSGYCQQYGQSGVTEPYSFGNVYACSPVATKGPTPFDSNGTQSFQCVDLSARFLWAIYGIWAGPGSGVLSGAQLVSNVHSRYPAVALGSPGPGSVPVPGDIISLGPGGGSDRSFGHTAVVISNNPSTGQFEIMSQNDPEGFAGNQNLQIDLAGGHNGRVVFNGSWTTAEWLKLVTSPPQRVSVPGDFDSTGHTQIAVFRPSTGQWFVAGDAPVQYGSNGDIPVPGDYDSTGHTQIAVFRPSTGQWFVAGDQPVTYGWNGDIPVPGDFHGTGHTQIAVFRPSTAQWFVAGDAPVQYGSSGDIPVSLMLNRLVLIQLGLVRAPA